MPTGYVKSIIVNVENKDTPEIAFTLVPTDGKEAQDVVYTFSGSPKEPHAYSTIEKLVTMAFQGGLSLNVTASGDEHYKEVLIVSLSK
jgi:hypothetical protein